MFNAEAVNSIAKKCYNICETVVYLYQQCHV